MTKKVLHIQVKLGTRIKNIYFILEHFFSSFSIEFEVILHTLLLQFQLQYICNFILSNDTNQNIPSHSTFIFYSLIYLQKKSNKRKNKLGLSWAKLSSNWNWKWVLLDLVLFHSVDWQKYYWLLWLPLQSTHH